MGEEWYGLPIESLREIVRPMVITPLPRVEPFVRGVMILRGEVLPVFDLHVRLGLSRPSRGAQARLLVVGEEGEKAAFEVEEVPGVWRPKAVQREAAPSSIGHGGELIDCLLREGEQFLVLLHLERCLGRDGQWRGREA